MKPKPLPNQTYYPNMSPAPFGAAIWSPSIAVKAVKRAPAAQISPVLSVSRSTRKGQNKQGASITLDSFQCTRLLGRGTFGMVFMARMKCRTAPCALKIVTKTDPRSKAQGYSELLSEQQILKTLCDNPHFVELQASWQTALNFYFMMVSTSSYLSRICGSRM